MKHQISVADALRDLLKYWEQTIRSLKHVQPGLTISIEGFLPERLQRAVQANHLPFS